MPETPRIEFPFFSVPGDPMLEGWRRFRDAVATAIERPSRTRLSAAAGTVPLSVPVPVPISASVPVPILPPGSRSGGIGVWRLLASNNREICRSARIFRTFDEARDDAEYLRKNADQLSTVRVIGPHPGMQGWYLRLDGMLVVTCSRWYEVSSSSADAATDVIPRLKLAELAPSLRRAAVARRAASGSAHLPKSAIRVNPLR